MLMQEPSLLEKQQKMLETFNDRILNYFQKTTEFQKTFEEQLELKQQRVEKILIHLFHYTQSNAEKEVRQRQENEQKEQNLIKRKNRLEFLSQMIINYRARLQEKKQFERRRKQMLDDLKKEKENRERQFHEKEEEKSRIYPLKIAPLIKLNKQTQQIKICLEKVSNPVEYIIEYDQNFDRFYIKTDNRVIHSATLQFNFHRDLGKLYDCLVCLSENS